MSADGTSPSPPTVPEDPTPASIRSSSVFRSALFGLPTLVAAGFAFSVYVATAAPGSWWGDGLELTTAAKVLGIPHPTGYPLYTLLGHGLLTLFGSIDAGRVMTLFSSFLCALASAFVGGAAYRVLRSVDREPGTALPSPVIDRGIASLIALGATLCTAFSWTAWDHATYAEVYPLTFAIVAALVFLVVRTESELESIPDASELRERTGGWIPLLLLSILTGLSTLNHYSAVAAAPFIFLAAFRWGRARNQAGGYVGMLGVIVALCLLGYLWIPFRAASNPPLNFGNPDSLGGLLWVLRGGDYGAIQILQAGGVNAWIPGAERWLSWWGEQVLGPGRSTASMVLGGFLALSAIGGNVLLIPRRRVWGWGGLGLIAATFAFSVLYRIPDIEGYFLPAIPGAVLGWSELVRRPMARAHLPQARPMIGASVGFLLLFLSIFILQLRLSDIDKSWDRGPEIWTNELLAALPEDALVLTRQGADSEIYALWYAQMVEGKRPDVHVFGTGFIFSGWYDTYFEAEGRKRIPIFVTERPPGDKADYDIALIGGVIIPNLKERRVFLTFQDPILEKYFSPKPVAELLPAEYYEQTAYRLNPPGPVLYELQRNLQFEPVALQSFQEMYGEAPAD